MSTSKERTVQALHSRMSAMDMVFDNTVGFQYLGMLLFHFEAFPWYHKKSACGLPTMTHVDEEAKRAPGCEARLPTGIKQAQHTWTHLHGFSRQREPKQIRTPEHLWGTHAYRYFVCPVAIRGGCLLDTTLGKATWIPRQISIVSSAHKLITK